LTEVANLAKLPVVAKIVNMHEAKTTLSRLVDEVVAGEEIVIAKAGRPVARLVPVAREKRRLGVWKGKVRMARDFDEPLSPEELTVWLGES